MDFQIFTIIIFIIGLDCYYQAKNVTQYAK